VKVWTTKTQRSRLRLGHASSAYLIAFDLRKVRDTEVIYLLLKSSAS
jgi:hypothetical protein